MKHKGIRDRSCINQDHEKKKLKKTEASISLSFAVCIYVWILKTMDKEQHDSMATVQMTKADYAASEVYSTTSEPPPVSLSTHFILLYTYIWLFKLHHNDNNGNAVTNSCSAWIWFETVKLCTYNVIDGAIVATFVMIALEWIEFEIVGIENHSPSDMRWKAYGTFRA